MQKEIKKTIEEMLRTYGVATSGLGIALTKAEFTKLEYNNLLKSNQYYILIDNDWKNLIEDYYTSIKGTAKGCILEWRYFKKKNYWHCLHELQKIKFYNEQANFYRLVNEIITDISIRASYERLINPYEYEK